ncbi:MAG: hypothetical protein IKQ49_02515 [Eubacterium sp.]|nr:hypothetical protein [Eubacterium sp.]
MARDSSPAVQTGWQKQNGKWYYLKPSGAMAANEYCKGYWLNKNGSWTYKPKASWRKDSTGWWYGEAAPFSAEIFAKKGEKECFPFSPECATMPHKYAEK